MCIHLWHTPKIPQTLRESENLVCSTVAGTKSAPCIVQIWFNYLATSFMSLGIDVSRETEKKVAIPVIALTRVTLLVCGNGHPICLFFSAFPEHQDT